MTPHDATARAERLYADWFDMAPTAEDVSDIARTDLIRLIAAALLDVQRDGDQYRLALESLTPGGSEFVSDAQRCVEYVRRIKSDYVAAMKENVRLRKAIREGQHE